MNLTVQRRGAMSRSATGFATSAGTSRSRMRQWSARALLFSLLAFVLTFGTPIMRAASIFEEDQSETKHRIELAPVTIHCDTDLRHRLPDYLPWGAASWLIATARVIAYGAGVPTGYYQTGPPPSRAPPSRLV